MTLASKIVGNTNAVVQGNANLTSAVTTQVTNLTSGVGALTTSLDTNMTANTTALVAGNQAIADSISTNVAGFSTAIEALGANMIESIDTLRKALISDEEVLTNDKKLDSVALDTAFSDLILPNNDDGINVFNPKVQGLQIYIKHGLKEYSKAFGRTTNSLFGDVTYRPETIVTMFSMTKSLINALMLIMDYKGMLNMNDNVSNWHPSFAPIDYFVIPEVATKEVLSNAQPGITHISSKGLILDFAQLLGHSSTVEITFTTPMGTDNVLLDIPMLDGTNTLTAVTAVSASLVSQLQNSGLVARARGGLTTDFTAVSGEIYICSSSGDDITVVFETDNKPIFTRFYNVVFNPLVRKVTGIDLAGNVGICPTPTNSSETLVVNPENGVTQEFVNAINLVEVCAWANGQMNTNNVAFPDGDREAFLSGGPEMTKQDYLMRILGTGIAASQVGEVGYGTDHLLLGAMLEKVYRVSQGLNPDTMEEWKISEILKKELFDKIGMEDSPTFYVGPEDERYLNYSKAAVGVPTVLPAATLPPGLVSNPNSQPYVFVEVNTVLNDGANPVRGDFSTAFEDTRGGMLMSCRDYGKFAELLLKMGLTSNGQRLFSATKFNFMKNTLAISNLDMSGRPIGSKLHVGQSPFKPEVKSLWGFLDTGPNVRDDDGITNGFEKLAGFEFLADRLSPYVYLPSVLNTNGAESVFGWYGAAQSGYAVVPDKELVVVYALNCIAGSGSAIFDMKNGVLEKINLAIADAVM